MIIKVDGGSAFPNSGFERWAPEGGMTLRDYFAAKALSGLTENAAGDYEWMAKQAYAAADAMLEARNK